MWLKRIDRIMLPHAPYLVAPSGLTGDAGITAGHYFHILCWYNYASGAVITRKAAFKKSKGQKKKSDWTPQEKHRGHIFVVHNVNSNTEGASMHLRGLTWTTEKRNCFHLSLPALYVSLRRAKRLVCSASHRPLACLTWAQTHIWLEQPWLLSNTRCKQSKANQLNCISRACCSRVS